MFRIFLFITFIGQLFAYKVYVSDDAVGGNFIYVIDSTTNQVIGTVRNPLTPFLVLTDLAVTPNQQLLYATDSNNTVYVISTVTDTVIATVANTTAVPFNTLQGIVIAPDGQTAYVTGRTPFGQVYVIDLATNTTTGTLSSIIPNFGSFAYHLAMTPDGQFLYVTNDTTGDPNMRTLNSVDLAAMQGGNIVNATLRAASVAVTPDGQSFYLSDRSAVFPNVWVGKTHELSPVLTPTTIGPTLGYGLPNWMAITPNGRFVYVTDPDPLPMYRCVHVIDTTLNEIITRVGPDGTFFSPQDIAITPDGRFGYVPDVARSTVFVFSTDTNQVITTVSTTGFRSFIQPILVAIVSPSERAFHRPNNRRR